MIDHATFNAVSLALLGILPGEALLHEIFLISLPI